MTEQTYTDAEQHAIANFATVGKLSDFVKGLNTFNGKPTDLVSWITDVEGIFDLFKDLPRTSAEYGILIRSIRRKIINEAADVLNANNVFYEWADIKNTLLLYYRDKRDVQTLDYELTTIRKLTNESLNSYYSRVNELLSAIIVQIQIDEEMQENAASHSDYFRKKALDSFTRGLEKPLNVLLKTADVKNLSKAYQFCMDYYNMDMRTAPFRNEHANHAIPKPRDLNVPNIPFSRKPIPPPRNYPPLPPKPLPRHFMQPPPPRFQQQFKSQFQSPFQPQYQPPFQPLFQQTQFAPQASIRNVKAEPMETDASMQSKLINYGNRPPMQIKRPASQQYPQSFKRVAHPLEYVEIEYPTSYYPDTTYDDYDEQFEDQPNDEILPEEQEGIDPQPSSSGTVPTNAPETNFFRVEPELVIPTLPYIYLKTNIGEFPFLIDTGANVNMIDPKLAYSYKISRPYEFKANNISSANGNFNATSAIDINFFHPKINHSAQFLLHKFHPFFKGIIGTGILTALNAQIDMENNFICLKKGAGKLKIPLLVHAPETNRTLNSLFRTDHLPTEKSKKLHDMLNTHSDIFHQPDQKLTCSTNVECTINTKDDIPVHQKVYPYPAAYADEVKKQIDKLLADGIIRPSRSAWTAPVWIVPKKSDASGVKKFRMVIDYRKINEKTVPDKYPMPEISYVLDQLKGQKYFSTLDLASGFHQIKMRDKDIEKTAFAINNGKYEFTRMPFGLKNAPAIFQRAIDDVLREHIGKICYVYIDDVIVFGRTFEEHLRNLNTVLETLKKANLRIQVDKSEFLHSELFRIYHNRKRH